VVFAASLSGCWLQPGFGPEHQSFNPLETALTADNVGTVSPVWTATTTYGGQPLVTGDRVVLGGIRSSGDTRTLGVEALDPTTGATVWTRDLISSTNPLLPLPAGTTILGDAIWAGYLPPQGNQTFETQFERLRPQDGSTLSTFVGPGYATTPVGDGHVIVDSSADFGSATTTLTVRDSATLSTLWTATPTLSSFHRTETVMSHGQLYVTSDTALVAFDTDGCGAATCTPLWTANVAGTGVTVVGATDDGHVIVTGTQPASGFYGPLGFVASYTSDGQLVWSRTSFPPTGGSGTRSFIDDVAIAGNTVLVADTVQEADMPQGPPGLTDHRLMALSTEGCGPQACVQWRTDLPSSSNALIGGGNVVYIAVGSEVRAFAVNGCGAATCPWLVDIPVTGTASAISVDGGRLYVTTTDNGQPRLTVFAPS
jgi:hypothetical protein